MKLNSFLAGIIIGFAAPLIGIVLFYFWKAPSAGFIDFLDAILHSGTLLTAAISFSLIVNVAVFTWAVNTRRDLAAKGIFLITLIIAIPAIAYKIFS